MYKLRNIAWITNDVTNDKSTVWFDDKVKMNVCTKCAGRLHYAMTHDNKETPIKNYFATACSNGHVQHKFYTENGHITHINPNGVAVTFTTVAGLTAWLFESDNQ